MYKGSLDTDSDEFREQLRQLVNEKKRRDKLRIDLLRAVWGEEEFGAEAIEFARKVAKSGESFMLIAEAGLGKEELMRHLFANSQRTYKQKKILSVNLQWFQPEEVIACMKDKNTYPDRNFFSRANGGILQLHHFDALPVEIQTQFVRLLKRKKFLHSSDPLEVQFIFSIANAPQKRMLGQELCPHLFAAIPHLQLRPLREKKGHPR